MKTITDKAASMTIMMRKRWMRYLVTVASFPLANHLADAQQVETCFNLPGIDIVG